MKKKEKEETINERVRRLRKDLGMTQQEFADKLRLTHAQISAIELSKSITTEQNIFLICSPNLLRDGKAVNYLWLKYGDNSVEKGKQEMFKKINENEEKKENKREHARGVSVKLLEDLININTVSYQK